MMAFKKHKESPRTRRYVYECTYHNVMSWAITNGVIRKSPNHKSNFPYYLEQYIKHLKKVRSYVESEE